MDFGGSIPPQDSGEDQTVVEGFISYINNYLDGVDGHPIKVDVCNIKNSEEEGAGCMDGFDNNPLVKTIDYGSLAVGSATETRPIMALSRLSCPLRSAGPTTPASTPTSSVPPGNCQAMLLVLSRFMALRTRSRL